MSFLNTAIGPLLFPSILWRTSEQALHLTFDDGPHPDATPRVLEILSKRQIHATFFLIGRNVRQYPDLARAILLSGHSIGNHTLTHRVMALRSKTFQKDEIQRTNDIIGEILNLRPLAFRPPYGYFDFDTLALSEEEKLRFVMWTVDARDFSESSADSILRNVTSRTAPGTVFLFHDNERTSAKLAGYLNPLLDRLLEHGLQFSQLPL